MTVSAAASDNSGVVLIVWRCVMPKVAFDLAEIAQEFMADFAAWYERAQRAKAEERLAADRVQNEADYLACGRRFQRLTNKALKRRWITALRRMFNEDRRRRSEVDDLGAELSLRKISKVDLPTDVRELVIGTPHAGAAG
jgi:hypothetical protein